MTQTVWCRFSSSCVNFDHFKVVVCMTMHYIESSSILNISHTMICVKAIRNFDKYAVSLILKQYCQGVLRAYNFHAYQCMHIHVPTHRMHICQRGNAGKDTISLSYYQPLNEICTAASFCEHTLYKSIHTDGPIEILPATISFQYSYPGITDDDTYCKYPDTNILHWVRKAQTKLFNALRSRQNGRHYAQNISNAFLTLQIIVFWCKFKVIHSLLIFGHVIGLRRTDSQLTVNASTF